MSTAVKTQSPASAAPTGQKVAPQTTGQKTLVGLLAVLAFVWVIPLAFILINIVVDLLYVLVNPRIRSI